MIMVVSIVVIVGLFLWLLVWCPFLTIQLMGKKTVTIGYQEVYKDPKAKAKFFGKDVSSKIKVKGKISSKKIGQYKITYSIHKLFTTKKVIRTVNVADQKKPELTLKGDTMIEVTVGDTFTDPGYEAKDDVLGDVTKKVKVTGTVDTSKVGEYKLNYTVKDKAGNESKVERTVTVVEKAQSKAKTPQINNTKLDNGYGNTIMGPTYKKGLLLVNKTYALPASYGSGVDATAYAALQQLQAAAKQAGHDMPLLSGYRSYDTQASLYTNYVKRDGKDAADTYSARPGFSEHQTGLAFDVGQISNSYGETAGGKWLRDHCQEYGFIIRYLKGKEAITGFQYEPWHIRYVGVDHAKTIQEKHLTLEEYLGVA